MSAAGTWAVIPVKPLRGALRRLTPALEAPVRRALQVAMLTDVLGACAGARGLAGVMVVTSDPQAREMAERDRRRPGGARPRPAAGDERRRRARARGGGRAPAPRAALVLTADLPLARPEDLEAVLAAAPPGPGAVFVPSVHGTGTNAMLLRPPGALTPRLGLDSLRAPPRPGRPARPGGGALRAPRPGPRHRHPARPGGPDGARRDGRDAGGLRAPGDRRHARGRERPLRLWPLSALPEVRPGDDLAGMLAARAGAEGVVPGDVLMVAQKVVSKAEGRLVVLAGVRPGPAALALAEETGKTPALCELILSESRADRPPARRHGDLRDPPRLRLRQRRHRLLERGRGLGGAAADRPRRLGAAPAGPRSPRRWAAGWGWS